MIDETGQAGAQNALPAGKQVNAKGSNDQWQRHLEKAYFERQRAAMQGQRPGEQPTAPSERDAAGGDYRGALTASVAAESGRHGGSGNKDKPLAVSAANQAPAGASGPASSTPTVRAHTPAASVAAPDQGRPALAQRSGDPVVAMQRANPAWRGTLPATSSASVLLSAQGAHLVVRDTSLSPHAARQLLGRLRALFAAEGQRLWALTLNGERLWQGHDHQQVAHSATDNDSDIDLQY